MSVPGPAHSHVAIIGNDGTVYAPRHLRPSYPKGVTRSQLQIGVGPAGQATLPKFPLLASLGRNGTRRRPAAGRNVAPHRANASHATAHATVAIQGAARNLTQSIVRSFARETQRQWAPVDAAGAVRGATAHGASGSGVIAPAAAPEWAAARPETKAIIRPKNASQLKRWTSASAAFEHASATSPVWVGMGLQLMACLLSAFGLIMQRASASRPPSRLLVAGGVGLSILSAVPDMASYIFAPQSLLALLCCVEPVLVCLFDMMLLPGDAILITHQEIFSTVFCVAGALGCAVFAPDGSAILKGPKAVDDNLHVRLSVYSLFILPALAFLAWEEHSDGRRRLPTWCRQFSLALLAGSSLALQRAALAFLGIEFRVAGGKLSTVVHSPVAALSVAVMALCGLSCLFHVWRGTQEQPPHVFVPVYCAISAAIQLAQSMVVLREYRDEPSRSVAYSVLFSAVSLVGVLGLRSEQGAPARAVRKKPPEPHSPGAPARHAIQVCD